MEDTDQVPCGPESDELVDADETSEAVSHKKHSTLVYIGRNEICGERCRWFSQRPTWVQTYQGTKYKEDGTGYEEYLGGWWNNNGYLGEMTHEATELLTGLNLEPGELKSLQIGNISPVMALLKKCVNPLSQCSCPNANNLAHEIRKFLNIHTDMWEKMTDSCTPDHDKPPGGEMVDAQVSGTCSHNGSASSTLAPGTEGE